MPAIIRKGLGKLIFCMREISLFWRRHRLIETDVGPMLDICRSAEFLAYIKRTPRDIRMLLKTKFQQGKGPEDLNSLFYLDLIEIHHEPEGDDDNWILNVKISHPLTNFNARTGGTVAMPGSRIDGEGMTYILQGGSMRLRMVAGMARLISKPDRISARNLDYAKSSESGPLNAKQLKMAKYAYDQGWYSINKNVKISELADGLGMARATLSEHLSRIESIVMADLLGSFSHMHVTKEEIELMADIIEADVKHLGLEPNSENYKLLQDIRAGMDEENLADDHMPDVDIE
jgi:hypothetical protein